MLKEHLFDLRPERPGFRLHKLELYNWGTFDSTSGQVYQFKPEGRTALLVGCNGSGKSTLVDAILTLLVPSPIRNYNVAAGAKKTERSEKSYIRGACGRGSDESNATVIKYLRPQGTNLTAILAVFRDEQTDRAFTLCQVLYVSGDSADKVFALSDEVRDLKHDLTGLKTSEQIRSHFNRLGYQTTKTFIEYDGWINKRTGMRGKALDMFNQTVAVKDIHSLNGFIRNHMLEGHDWRETVQPLLTHFNDLSQAHQELVRAQLAEQLLTPIEQIGESYAQQAKELQALDRRLKASATFFATETVRICEPELVKRRDELAAAVATRDQIANELEILAEEIRTLKNDIDQAGGQRLRDIPGLIREQNSQHDSKHHASQRYHHQLSNCGIDDQIGSAQAFGVMRQRLHSELQSVQQRMDQVNELYENQLTQRADLNRKIKYEQAELHVLSQRQTNLASHFTSLRSQICDELQLAESELPFAAELISVVPEERRWEASIEMVLRSFALSLLVPERLYPRVRAYVEGTRMANDRGEGQRLVYLRVGKGDSDDPRVDRIHTQSIFRKLKFRSGHDLAPWVRSQILQRFDFRCCDSIEQFNEVDRLGMTENRHVKFGTDRHEKDDRPRAVEPRYFVLGWDNREKRRLIAENLVALQAELSSLEQTMAARKAAVEALRDRLIAARLALEITDFDAIDFHSHAVKIAALQQEKADLESANEAIKSLQITVKAKEHSSDVLGKTRDEAIKREQSLSERIEREIDLIDNAQTIVSNARRDGTYDIHAVEFSAIVDSLGPPDMSIADLFVREQRWPEQARLQMDIIRRELQPLSEKLLAAMNRFLGEFKEHRTDLSATVDALDSFLHLFRRVRDEDLPRHVKKFKDRLNDKVSQEVALLNRALRKECKHIEEKIRQLNIALAELDFQAESSSQPATFIKLEPREVIDRDIAEFRRALRECLDESLENTEEANEARFLRIKKLVERLADKDNTKWRDKVIDVRYWYAFAAREVQRNDGVTRSYYEDSAGQSGGEKAKLAFTILVAALAYQFDIDPTGRTPERFHFVVVDEMFSKVDDHNAQYALKLFQQFGLQLLIVAPLDAKARVTESFVDSYLQAVKDEATHHSELYSMTAREYEDVLKGFPADGKKDKSRMAAAK